MYGFRKGLSKILPRQKNLLNFRGYVCSRLTCKTNFSDKNLGTIACSSIMRCQFCVKNLFIQRLDGRSTPHYTFKEGSFHAPTFLCIKLLCFCLHTLKGQLGLHYTPAQCTQVLPNDCFSQKLMTGLFYWKLKFTS